MKKTNKIEKITGQTDQKNSTSTIPTNPSSQFDSVRKMISRLRQTYPEATRLFQIHEYTSELIVLCNAPGKESEFNAESIDQNNFDIISTDSNGVQDPFFIQLAKILKFLKSNTQKRLADLVCQMSELKPVLSESCKDIKRDSNQEDDESDDKDTPDQDKPISQQQPIFV